MDETTRTSSFVGSLEGTETLASRREKAGCFLWVGAKADQVKNGNERSAKVAMLVLLLIMEGVAQKRQTKSGTGRMILLVVFSWNMTNCWKS